MIDKLVKSLKSNNQPNTYTDVLVKSGSLPSYGLVNEYNSQCEFEESNLSKCSSGESLSLWINKSITDDIFSHKSYIVNDTSPYNVISAPKSKSLFRKARWLKPRMKFTGYQISGYKKYQITVELKTTNFPHSGSTCSLLTPHLCGYLTIQGLTNQHPEITTYFESFLVNESIGFLSSSIPEELSDLKSNNENDLEHWLNFPNFRELCMNNYGNSNTLQKIILGEYCHMNYLDERFIYMRWKEKFLVPQSQIDSVDKVEGASYDGYYYIVHDQFLGGILGFYYHKDAEKFQQLELQPMTSGLTSDCTFEFA